MKFFCCIIFLLMSTISKGQNISLQNLEGKPYSLTTSTTKATVIFFLLPDCPACKTYSLTMNKLYREYADKNVSFIGIFPGTYYSIDEMKKYETDFKIQFILLADTGKKMVQHLNATIAPSAFILDQSGKIQYSGRIDDLYFRPGRKRTVVTKNELADALHAFVAGKEIQVKKTNAIGCFID